MSVTAGRLSAEELASNFSDLHPPLSAHEAQVAADRCYFCHDAPCVTACPTDIDIPMFIRQIAAGRPREAGKTILDQNILGGMCARVCPTETLCEEACVRETAEQEPVLIGRLQRFATDAVMAAGSQPYARSAPSGKSVAVVGAGPAGIACAHRLSMHGHDVVLFDANQKAGGLNEYGIAAYKTVENFAAREVEWILSIGGIRLETGKRLGQDLDLETLRADYDAVVLAIGLGGVNALDVDGEGASGVEDAVAFIARVRQDPPETIPVGRNVVVIGGGMTAIDAAVQAKLLGAETVTIAYRRGRGDMPASTWEQDLAASRGVTIRENLQPLKIVGDQAVSAIECTYTQVSPDTGKLEATDETITLNADHVLKAIGQTLVTEDTLRLSGGRISVDAEGRTALDKVWAAGDCAEGGDELTVTAVAQGRDVAESIHRTLTA